MPSNHRTSRQSGPLKDSAVLPVHHGFSPLQAGVSQARIDGPESRERSVSGATRVQHRPLPLNDSVARLAHPGESNTRTSLGVPRSASVGRGLGGPS